MKFEVLASLSSVRLHFPCSVEAFLRVFCLFGWLVSYGMVGVLVLASRRTGAVYISIPSLAPRLGDVPYHVFHGMGNWRRSSVEDLAGGLSPPPPHVCILYPKHTILPGVVCTEYHTVCQEHVLSLCPYHR